MIENSGEDVYTHCIQTIFWNNSNIMEFEEQEEIEEEIVKQEVKEEPADH